MYNVLLVGMPDIVLACRESNKASESDNERGK